MIFINSFKWQQKLWATQNSKTLYIVPIIQSTWNHLWHLLTLALPSVLWRCWLGSRKGIRPVKNWAVGCWRVICLEWGADSTGKYRQNKLNTNQKNTILGQQTRWADSTTPPSPHEANSLASLHTEKKLPWYTCIHICCTHSEFKTS